MFSECVELLRSSSDVSVVHTHLSVLLCSAVLERVLGDVSHILAQSYVHDVYALLCMWECERECLCVCIVCI